MASSGTAELTFVLQNDIPEGSPFGVNRVRWTQVSGFTSLYSRNRARRFALSLPDGTTDLSAIRLAREDDPDTTDRVENANYVEYHGLAYIGPTASTHESTSLILCLQRSYESKLFCFPTMTMVLMITIRGPTDTTLAQANYNALEGENIGLGIQFDRAHGRRLLFQVVRLRIMVFI